ncbi:MAG: Gfo/Idh/MocA family oxidoreductase [Anaerolineae bacterium]|jgi:predicted dehydrogenase|nr:Gfo/Idh/MocA family oxidoreductase [Anaerolineae bacterium]
MTILRGGVIGFGNIGQNLTRYINQHKQDEARIVAACNRGKSNLDIARGEYGLAVTHDVRELVNMDLDFVLVVSTSYAHAEQVTLAAEAGLHVFCEKPIALTLEDADRTIEAVESAGVVNVVNYSMRYIDAYLKIRDMINSGEMGRLLSICHFKTRAFGLYSAGARHRAVIEPEESGGWTVHHACHDIDFLYWINGPMTRAYAMTQTTAPGKDSEEVVLGSVVFENGASGLIGDSVCCIRDHYTQIIGTQASLIMRGEHDETVLRFHREGAQEPEIIPARDTKRLGGGTDHFLACIREGKQSPNSLRSARHSLAVALAMQESALTGQVVEVG